MNDYCPWLLAQGIGTQIKIGLTIIMIITVSQCSGLGPDAPIPPKSIFGGIYQVDDDSKVTLTLDFLEAQK